MNIDKNKIGFTLISDTHILARELMDDNREFNMAVKYDRKFLVEGQGLLKKALELATINGSKYLLIPGDLTKDGEKKSHLEIAKILKDWKEKDKDRRIFLISGNHDINNNQAYDYKNLKKAETIEPKDFINIYDFAFCENILSFYRDSLFFKQRLENVNKTYNRKIEDTYYCQGYLSYSARIDPLLQNKNSISLIFLDSSIYSIDHEQNHRDRKNNVVGVIDKNLMKWTLIEIEKAKKRKDMIFVFSHHALIPNFRDQRLVLGPFVIKNWNKKYEDSDPKINGKLPIEVLADSKVKFVFTGHLHENGTAKYKSKLENEIFNIQTGSTVTYPLPIREINVYDDIQEFKGFALTMKTQLIKSFEFTNLRDEDIKIENSIKYALENQLSLRDVLFNYIHSMAQNSVLSNMKVKDLLIENLSKNLNVKLSKDTYIEDLFISYEDRFPIHIDKFGDLSLIKSDGEIFLKINSYRSQALIKSEDLKEAIDILIEQFEEKIMKPDHIIYYYDKLMKKGLSMPISEKYKETLYDFSNYIYQYKALDENTTPSYVVEFIAKLNNPNYSITDEIIDYCEDEINEIFDFLTTNIIFEKDGSKDRFFDLLFTTRGLFFSTLVAYIKRKSNNLNQLLTFIAKFVLKKRFVKGVDIAKFIVSYKKVTRLKENMGEKILGRANLRSYIIDLVKSINREVIETYENEDLNERDHYFSYVEYEDIQK